MYKLLFVGDIMPGELPQRYGSGFATIFRDSDANYPFANVKKILKQGDLVIGNLECVLSNKSDRSWPDSNFLRGSPEFATRIKEAGFKIMNVANNHIMDHGLEAFTDTINVLEKNGINYFGSTDKGKRQEKLLRHSVGDLRIGLLGYTIEIGISGRFDYVDTDYLYQIQNKIADLQRLEVVIKEMTNSCRNNNDQSHCPIIDSLK